MTELKLYAVHFGVWFFLWIFPVTSTAVEKKWTDAKFTFELFSTPFCMAIPSFALHWGLT